jgi:hypothetical protein
MRAMHAKKGPCTNLSYKLSYSRAIPSYRCGQMDKCKLCFAHNNMRALCDMFMRSWAILGFNKTNFIPSIILVVRDATTSSTVCFLVCDI